MRHLFRFELMSSPCELQIFHANQAKASSLAQAVLEQGKRLEKIYNYYDERSMLSAINARTLTTLDPQSKWLLGEAKRFYTATSGAFDITLATLKPCYANATSKIALEDALQARMPYVGMEHVRLVRKRIEFDNPYTQIDLGGMVKEFAVDEAARVLQQKKVAHALINYGGDIRAIGCKESGEAFVIGVKDPCNKEKIAKQLAICNESVATSASYERFDVIENETYSHILSTTERCRPQSVTVIAPTCLEAGVYSTALMSGATLQIPYTHFIL